MRSFYAFFLLVLLGCHCSCFVHVGFCFLFSHRFQWCWLIISIQFEISGKKSRQKNIRFLYLSQSENARETFPHLHIYDVCVCVRTFRCVFGERESARELNQVCGWRVWAPGARSTPMHRTAQRSAHGIRIDHWQERHKSFRYKYSSWVAHISTVFGLLQLRLFGCWSWHRAAIARITCSISNEMILILSIRFPMKSTFDSQATFSLERTKKKPIHLKNPILRNKYPFRIFAILVIYSEWLERARSISLVNCSPYEFQSKVLLQHRSHSPCVCERAGVSKESTRYGIVHGETVLWPERTVRCAFASARHTRLNYYSIFFCYCCCCNFTFITFALLL